MQADERVDLRHGAAGQIQARQLRQRHDGVHRRSRERAAGQIERPQQRQPGQDGQIERRAVVQGQGAQAGEVGEIVQRGDRIGKVQRLDGPELVGHDGAARRLAQQLTHIGVKTCVGKLDFFHNVADGIARVGRVAYKAVFRHAQRDDAAFTGFQRDGADIYILRRGGEIAVAHGVDRARRAGDGHVDVFRVIAAFRLDDGRGGAQRVDLCADGVVCNAAEHCLRVKQLVLLHIRPGKRDIEGNRIRDLCNGADKGVFRLCVVAALFIGVGQPDGKLRVLRREAHGRLVERDRAGIAPGLIEMLTPVDEDAFGHIAACDQEKPARADDDGKDQDDRENDFQSVLHI